ncbi:MAG TPA: amino acid adenylation domain-containing protein, partial [Longimicrobium sp.]|nr:amino acid adenylation domain-containing protein [Longimicrobium sp.]
MTLEALLAEMAAEDVRLRRRDGQLDVFSSREVLSPSLISALRIHKSTLLDIIGDGDDRWWSPPPVTPERLPLASLAQAEIDRVVAGVQGGAANLQDIYPLAPLQEGILFHHLLAADGDPYLLRSVTSFEARARLDDYLAALRAVIGRHDILRTGVVWEGVSEPVQVVWRSVSLPVDEVRLDPAAGDAVSQLLRRFGAHAHPLDISRPPLLRAIVAHDPAGARWLLLLVMHHLAGDHTTLDILQGEVEAHLAGAADRLPPALPFRGYVERTRQGLSRAEHEAFFRELLGDVHAPTVPFGLQDARGGGAGAARARVAVDGELAGRLRAQARSLGVTAASLFHVAWAQVLARVSGRADVVFGTVLVGRMDGGPGADRVLGPLLNTLPVRVQVGEAGVEATVRRMHALLADLLHHEHASLALAQRCSGVEAPTPLFSALLNYRRGGDAGAGKRHAPGARGALAGVSRVAGLAGTHYPLALSVDDDGDGFALSAQAADGVDPGQVLQLMQTALAALGGALATAPATAVGRVDVLPAGERQRVVALWNATGAPYPDGSCLHELFEARAARTPDAVAVVSGGASLGYGELNARANRLAHHLRALGVGPDTPVAVCVQRGLEMVVGLLGVLKAGGAYVPLDPSYPADRLEYMLKDSRPAALLTRRSLAGRLRDVRVPVVELEAENPALAAQPATNPGRGALTPDHLAYVMYTSGSTGRPKGVQAAHRGVLNLVHWYMAELAITDRDAVLIPTSFSFDLTQRNLFAPLFAGGRLHLAGEPFDPRGILAQIEGSGITLMNLTSTAFHALIDAGRGTELAGMRLVVLGGEPARPGKLRELAGPRPEFVNAYGPTECSGVATYHRLSPELESYGGGSAPIGRPLANSRVYVADDRGEPVPVGVVGEMWIGGVGVSRGYIHQPGLTAERFVPDGLGAEPGGRLYRTGDLARWRPDGTLEFVGRNDFQVKVRGFRVELREVEARLLEHAAVREAVVVAREDAPGDQRLVAYYVGAEGVEVDALRAHLAERLPEYMVPAACVRLEALPLTPTGKVDRRALPAPAGDAYARRDYEAPVGEVEVALAEIWADVLGVERVGRRDDFFDLGGHSLLAIRVLSRARQVLAVELALGEVFQRPVLADFAQGLERAQRAELPPIERADRGAPLPLSFAQQRLWFLETMGGLGGTYHIPRRLRLAGALDRDALRRALDRIVARHEALRTTFGRVDGAPVQRIAADERGFALSEHDLRGDPDAEEALHRVTAAEARTPFDLERGPLFRGRLVRLADDDHVLLLTMHHIVSDAWSMGLLVRELGALYAAFRAGEPDPLPPLPVQYADYAAWQRRWMEGAVLEAQAAYWRETLAGAPELLELPADRPRPARVDHAGAVVELALDAEATAELKALSRRQGTTLFMTLLAGWAAVLSRLSGQDDVVIGTPTANRGRTEIEGLIGLFVNTLAVRVDLGESPTVAELLARVKARTLEAQQHQDLPFERVVELLQPTRSLAHHPLFQVLFAWQNAPGGRLALPGLRVDAEGGRARETAKFDLSLTLQEAGGRIGGFVTYATALFERATAERYLGYLERVLEQMVVDDARAVERLALLPEAERRQVVEEWNATDAAYPIGLCLHELFEAQVARTPDAAAVSFAGETLTYAELNARANRLAHHLRALGVGPDARVALCVERSAEMVVGLLAVLKAGGAYVPLDPSHPAERLRFMLADSAPAAVLAQQALGAEPRALLGGLDVPVLVLDAAAPAWTDAPAHDPVRAGLTPEHLAYVIYTSGSTGQPKGAMNAHRGVINRLAWMQERYGLRADEAVLQKTPYGFDVSVWEFFWPLVVGSRLVVARPEGHKDPAYLAETIRREGITTMHFVPSMLREFLGHPRAEECTGLVRVVCSGEALPSGLVERFHARLPGTELHNLYGPTEAAVDVTAWHCSPGAGGLVPIGRPMANTRMYVLDRVGAPVPVGVTGELYIGGVQVARGYLGRPGLTAERFVADPFGSEPGARLYRTGDLGRWRVDGSIEFLGRTDFQVKVRGHRIELGEIEARLAEHAAVREAVVVAREDAQGDQRLVADDAGAAAVEVEALRAHLAERLPEHMVPAAYVRLAALPLTPSGKLDRRALPAPEGDAYARRAYEEPAGEAEQAVAEIWSEVLGVERVGRWDHFFALGGHSLLAVQVVSRVRQALAVEAALGEVFARPVLAEFARGLEAAAHAALPAIEPVDRQGDVPLSFAQQRLWFLEQLGGMGATYHVPRRLRLAGALDREALRRALDRIVARHEALRTTFDEVDGAPVQRIAPIAASAFTLVEHDLQGEADADQSLHDLVAEEARAPFDLAAGPLIRGRLIRLAAEDHVLLITMHHVVSDAWSMGLFVRELSALYAAFRVGEADPLPPLPVQYADYAVWQRRWVDGEVLQRQTEYWKQTLAGAPELLELPTDRPRPARVDHAGAVVGLALDEALTAGLKALGRRQGTTLFMTLLAGW